MKKINIANVKAFAGSLLIIPFFFAAINVSSAFNMIGTQLDPGSTGTDVTNLQTFLSSNSSIYPEALVTGYFGDLTTVAVKRFQYNYGIDQAGRVGPATLLKINSLIENGSWVNVNTNSETSAPIIYYTNSNTSISRNSATFKWITNENSISKVFYSTSPVIINEGDINYNGFGLISGYTSNGDLVSKTSQEVTVSGLQPNTLYYYMLVSTDISGNISVAAVNNTFVTTN